MKASKYIIVGAGLSGLTAGYSLLKQGEEDFIVLEARDRVGGRIITDESIDLGATWFQDHHQTLSSLLEELGIGKFRQYSKGRGIFIYSSMAPAQYFENSDESTSAFRISGGSSSLIKAIKNKLGDRIRLNQQVHEIERSGSEIQVSTQDQTFTTEKIIVAIPPRILPGISWKPELSEALTYAMVNTHTWMSNAIKVGILYDRPFWREKSLSGTIIGHVSPAIELYDHTNDEETRFSLMGFVNEGLRDESAADRKERILAYLEKHFGSEARDFLDYKEKDWSTDKWTSGTDLKSVYISPRYGNPIFQNALWDDSLFIASAETSVLHGGYMDGAIQSGMNVVSRILGLNEN